MAIGVLALIGQLPELIVLPSSSRKPRMPWACTRCSPIITRHPASATRRDELAKIVALRPDDSNLRIQVAQQLLQENQIPAAIEHYRTVLKQDPSALGRNIRQVQNAFQRRQDQ